LTTLLTDFIALLYPEICIGCGNALEQKEQMICISCSVEMPRTNFENHPANPVERLFWYKIKIEEATAGYFFSKKSRIQRMIHSFKYRGNSEAAFFLGQKLGLILKRSNRFNTIQKIIPVPLHPEKQKVRGYNQAEQIAHGISFVMKIPVDITSLIRDKSNSTQTKKNLFNRWTNVSTIFKVIKPGQIKNTHILLVDDVITSGSTIESCAQKILQVENSNVSIATLAIANG
jgi:ComF family protein